MDAEGRSGLQQFLDQTQKDIAELNGRAERLATEEVKDLRAEKLKLEAENARLQRQLTLAERKDAALTLRMPQALLDRISAAARTEGRQSPAGFIFELLARLQQNDLLVAFEAFDDPAFGTELDAMAHNLGCRPGEVLRVISEAMPGQISKLCEERSRRQTGENRPDEQLS